MTDKPTCESCRWWGETSGWAYADGGRECRRYPPIKPPPASHVSVYSWPRTTGRDFCGEHTPKPEAK